MATGVKTFTVDIATNPSTLIQTANPAASNAANTIQVNQIIAVTPIFYDYSVAGTSADAGDLKNTYPYPTMTKLLIDLRDGTHLVWELQSITNQPTWNTGTLAALKVAATAINTLL